MKPFHVVISAYLVALLVFSGCGSRINNSTPEAAARSFVKAEIAGDSKALNALNKSGFDCSTSRILDIAAAEKVVGSDISNYEFIDRGGFNVVVRNKKSGQSVMALRFIFADGGYYFVRFLPINSVEPSNSDRIASGDAYAHGKGVTRDYAKAIQFYKEAADQGDAVAQNSVAWMYAACKDPKYQDGKKAVEFATKAVSQQPKTWYFVGTLSGAYARNNQFDEAVVEAKRSIELLRSYDGAVPGGKEKWLAKLADMSESFRKHQPFTDTDD